MVGRSLGPWGALSAPLRRLNAFRGDVRATIQRRLDANSARLAARVPGLEDTVVIAHVGFCFTLASFAMSDMLSLRSLALCGNSVWMLNAITRKPVPLASFGWQIVFLGINGTMLVLLLNEERAVQFADEEMELYETHFHPHGIKPMKFKKLLAQACGSASYSCCPFDTSASAPLQVCIRS